MGVQEGCQVPCSSKDTFDTVPISMASTEFYLLTENESGDLVAAGYPTNMTRGESGSLVVGIGNQGHESVEYTVVVELQRVEIVNGTATVFHCAAIGGHRSFLQTIHGSQRRCRGLHRVRHSAPADRELPPQGDCLEVIGERVLGLVSSTSPQERSKTIRMQTRRAGRRISGSFNGPAGRSFASAEGACIGHCSPQTDHGRRAAMAMPSFLHGDSGLSVGASCFPSPRDIA